jgi:hypothetical protein
MQVAEVALPLRLVVLWLVQQEVWVAAVMVLTMIVGEIQVAGPLELLILVEAAAQGGMLVAQE